MIGDGTIVSPRGTLFQKGHHHRNSGLIGGGLVGDAMGGERRKGVQIGDRLLDEEGHEVRINVSIALNVSLSRADEIIFLLKCLYVFQGDCLNQMADTYLCIIVLMFSRSYDFALQIYSRLECGYVHSLQWTERTILFTVLLSDPFGV